MTVAILFSLSFGPIIMQTLGYEDILAPRIRAIKLTAVQLKLAYRDMDFDRLTEKLGVIDSLILYPLTRITFFVLSVSFVAAIVSYTMFEYAHYWNSTVDPGSEFIWPCPEFIWHVHLYTAASAICFFLYIAAVPLIKSVNSMHAKIRDEQYLIGRQLVSAEGRKEKAD